MIILINGSINSGKSTISKLLVEKIPNTALLEIDSLREMISWMPLHDSIPLNLQNAVSLIKNFVERKINVVVPYPLSEDNYNFVVDQLKDLGTKIYTFTLSPKLEKAVTDRGGRPLVDWEVNRIKEQYGKNIHNPSFGEVIDNSSHSPEETVEIILSKLK